MKKKYLLSGLLHCGIVIAILFACDHLLDRSLATILLFSFLPISAIIMGMLPSAFFVIEKNKEGSAMGIADAIALLLYGALIFAFSQGWNNQAVTWIQASRMISGIFIGLMVPTIFLKSVSGCKVCKSKMEVIELKWIDPRHIEKFTEDIRKTQENTVKLQQTINQLTDFYDKNNHYLLSLIRCTAGHQNYLCLQYLERSSKGKYRKVQQMEEVIPLTPFVATALIKARERV